MTLCTLRSIGPADRAVVERLLIEMWGSAEVYAVALGGMVNASGLPGWIAEQDGAVVGLLTYRLSGTTVDIVTINSRGDGVGTMLVEKLAGQAPAFGAKRIRVATTNDNTHALRFYQRCGFRLSALHADAMTKARRRHKPQIPELGQDGIPIRDEIDLVLPV